MVTPKYVTANGREVSTGDRVIPDNHVQQFSVVIRSGSGLSEGQVQRHLQKLWEVRGVIETAHTVVVQGD